MQITFKVAEKSDIERLVPFVREFYEDDHHLFDEQIVRSGLAEFLSSEKLGRLWIIQADAQAVGYIALMFGYRLGHGYDAFVDEIYVRSPYRSRGIGRQALAFAEETCRNLGVRAIYLEVERENSKARALYTAVGYVDNGHYLMTCWLGPSQTQSTLAGETPGDSSLFYPLRVPHSASFKMTSENPITFKPAQHSDIETLLNLTPEAARENSRTTLPRLIADASLGWVWLIEADEEPVGYVAITFSYSFEFHGRDAILDRLYLCEPYRQKLSVPGLEFAQAQCYSLGVNALHAEMERNNLPAQAIYRAAGFEDDDSFLMTKWLDV